MKRQYGNASYLNHKALIDNLLARSTSPKANGNPYGLDFRNTIMYADHHRRTFSWIPNGVFDIPVAEG